MSITSSKKIIHCGADLSSDFGQKAFVGRGADQAIQRERFATPTSTMVTLQAYPVHTTEARSTLSSSTKQTTSEHKSPPNWYKESMVEWKSPPADNNMKRMSTIDVYQGLFANSPEMLGTLESLPSACHDEGVRSLLERVHLKNTFVDFDDDLDPDYELPMQPKCLSDQAPAKKTCMKSDFEEAEYGATLRHRAARLREMPQSIPPNVDVQQKRAQLSVVGRDATVSQNRDIKPIRLFPTKKDDLGRRDGTMASAPSYQGTSDTLDAATGQANIQLECLSRAVTTLMVCNLPCALSSEGLTQVVDELGFRCMYDLIYVPKGAKKFLGYGFVNFLEPDDAARFSRTIHSYTFQGNLSKKAYCKVAEFQGSQNTLRHISRGNNYRRRAQIPVTN